MATRQGDERLAAKRRRRRLRGLVPWLLGLLAAAIVAVAVYAVYLSPWLDLREVKINGDRTIAATRVEQAAAAPVGTPLARLDLDVIAARVAAVPQVASVDVQREWPHAVRIVIVEREPVARLRDRDRWVAVDADGVVFPTDAPGLKSLPLVEVKGGVNYADPATITGVARTIAVLPRRVDRQVTRVTAQTLDSITLHLTRGRTVVWGNAEQGEAKARVIATALRKLDEDRFDVSVPSNLKVS